MVPQPNFQTVPHVYTLHAANELDVVVECLAGHVWYKGLKVQFPNALREHNRQYRCDLRPVVKNGSISFYSAVKGTIRDIVTGQRVG